MTVRRRTLCTFRMQYINLFQENRNLYLLTAQFFHGDGVFSLNEASQFLFSRRQALFHLQRAQSF